MKLIEFIAGVSLLTSTFLVIGLCETNMVGACISLVVMLLTAVLAKMAGCWSDD